MNYELWRVGEWTFTDTNAPKAADCGITATFTGPDGTVMTRDAFYDGGDTFRVRFAPTKLGKWDYIVTGLSAGDAKGDIQCVPYSGDKDIFKHGFLKVGPQGKYLCHDDNTPFFWLGDTHWHFAIREKWDESNDPRFDSQFRAIVDRRAKQRFNVYQCNFHCEYQPQGDTPAYFTKNGNQWQPNVEFLQNDLDRKMAYLADSGMSIAVGFTWFFSILMPGADEFYKMAARYLIARYGAYPILWTLAGEVGGYGETMRPALLDGWRKIALEIQRKDDYHHLRTAHYTNERPFPTYYQGEEWFDFTLGQAGHGDYPIDCRPFRKHIKQYPTTPFIEGESLYENVLTLEPNGRRRATPAMLRRVAYLAMQNGACGYTYGAQGMWHIQWEEGANGPMDLGFGSFDPWYRAIDFPGADQMTIMRDFYESVHWHSLRPLDPSCFAANKSGGLVITFSAEDLQALFMPSALGSEDMSTVVAYYAETNRFPMGFRTLIQPKYKAHWFDPETGEYTLINDNIRPKNGVWFAPQKMTQQDAILVIRAVEV